MIDIDRLTQLRAKLLLPLMPNDAINRALECRIVLSDNMRSTAGRAKYRDNIIILNRRLLSDNPHHIEQTFVHELAHIVSYSLYGNDGLGHGANWQGIMRKFGYEAIRCHNLDTSKYKRRHAIKGQARCQCKTHNLKAIRYNKIMRGAKYSCRLCYSYLELIK